MNPKKLTDTIMKNVVALLSERDQSIRESFLNMEQHTKGGLSALDFKITVLIRALQELGMPESKLQSIANDLRNQIMHAQNAGGQTNEPYNGHTASENNEDTEQSEDVKSVEGGTEYFK